MCIDSRHITSDILSYLSVPSHQPQPAGILKLNCWVLGDEMRRVFPVEIAETESVGILKDAIKQKKPVSFQHVDADAIEIWKVCIATVS